MGFICNAPQSHNNYYEYRAYTSCCKFMLIFFSVYLDDILGQIFSLYVLTVARLNRQ